MYMPKWVAILALPLAMSGCAVHYDGVHLGQNGQVVANMTPELQSNIKALETALISMSPNTISPAEAKAVAYDAYVYPMYLANDWNLTTPPLTHNTLRNFDKRKAGLWVDWARAMRARMRSKHLKTFDLYWGIAYQGNAWREHSTLIVTAKGKPFSSGIILDPWRDSGRLFWSRIPNDQRYPWKYFEGPG